MSRSPEGAVTGRAILAFLGLAALLVLREPGLWRAPRFWAEEGALYFHHAFNHGAWETLTFSVHGYLSLHANLAAMVASSAPLESAPAVTTLAGAAVQLAVLAVVLFGRLSFLPNLGARVLAGLVVSLVGMTDELWLNSINGHSHLGLLSALLVLDERPWASTRRRLAQACMLFYAALGGVYTCVLAPLFLERAWRTRRRHDVEALVAVGLGCLVQVAFLASRAEATVGRAELTLEHASSVVHHLLAYPLLPLEGRVLPLLALVGLALVVALLRSPGKRRFVLASLLLSGIPLSVALWGGAETRYAYAGSVVLQLGLLALAFDTARPRGLRAVAALAVAVALAAGAASYPIERGRGYDPAWTDWRDEVAAWREDQRAWLRIHPQSGGVTRAGWRMRLTVDDIREAPGHGTPPVTLTDERIELPVTHVPALGNMSLGFGRVAEGEWLLDDFHFLPDAAFPSAELTLGYGAFRFLATDGSVRTLRVVDLVEPFGYRVRLEPPSTTPQDR